MAEKTQTDIACRVLAALLALLLSLGVPLAASHATERVQIRTVDPLTQPWRITRYPELAGRGVRSIAEDKQGNFWFGLKDGVVRYDGYRWIDHDVSEGLRGISVDALVTGHDGVLLAGTPEGVYRREGSRWHRIFPVSGGDRLAVSALAIAPNGFIWACSDFGLIRIDGDQSTLFTSKLLVEQIAQMRIFDQIAGLPHRCLPWKSTNQGTGVERLGRRVVLMSEDSPAKRAGLQLGDSIVSIGNVSVESRLRLGRNPGRTIKMVVRRRKTGLHETIQFTTESIGNRFRCPAMHSVMIDREARVWAGATEGSLMMSADDGKTWQAWKGDDNFQVGRRPFALHRAGGEVVVFSESRSGNVSRFDGSTWSTQKLTRMTGARFQASGVESADGDLWAGALNRLHLEHNGVWEMYDTRNLGIPGDGHRFLAASDGSIWIIGQGQHAVRIAISEAEFWSLETSRYGCTDESGTRWYVDTATRRIVKQRGDDVVAFGPEDNVIDRPSGILAVPGAGVVAFGGHEGVASVATWDGQKWSHVSFPRVARDLSGAITAVSSDGRVWIAAKRNRNDDQIGGVVAGIGANWTHFEPPDAPKHPEFIVELPDGRMMLGGGFGTVIYDGQQWINAFENELSDAACTSAVIDPSGNTWIGTRSRGVLRSDGDRWVSYTTAAKTMMTEVSSLAIGGHDDVWVSTADGLCRFDGSEFRPTPLPGKLGRHDLKFEGRSIWFDRMHRYTPDQKPPRVWADEQTIDVGANSRALVRWRGVDAWNRTAAEQLEWSYRIDNEAWSPFQRQRQMVLEGLPSGDHVVEVRARDGDLNVSAESALIAVTVLPPFFLQGWFLTFSGVLAAIIAWLSASLVRRGVSLRHTNLELANARTLLAEKYAEKSAQFRTICDCSPVGIFVADNTSALTYANRQLVTILGQSRFESLGSGWVNAIHPEDRNEFVAAWQATFQSRHPFHGSGRFLHKDGTVTWFDVVAHAIETSGEFIGYVGAVDDVTKDVLGSRDLRNSNAQLQQALTQLEEAQVKAIQRERLSALGQMAAGVAHDMNNALAPVLTYAELLAADHDIIGKNRERVELIRLGVSDTADIVKRLEHFYRETHNPKLLQAVPLADIVAEAVQLTRPRWRYAAMKAGKTIDVTIDRQANPLIDCLPSQIRSVLTNLIFNAVDAVECEGMVSVRVTQRDDRALLEVVDNGAGMNAEQVERCLEPFYSSKPGGSGLGLSECHGVVRQHGGRIEVQSAPGEGTRVEILLPLSQSETSVDETSVDETSVAETSVAGRTGQADQGKPPPANSRKRTFAKKRVLYIDDDLQVRRSSAAMLKSLGIEVEVAGDGPAGIELIEIAPFDLVICDQGLPGMDGITVLNEIKRLRPEVPVVIISGWSLPEATGGVKPDGFLGKPVAYDQFLGLLQQYLSSANAA